MRLELVIGKKDVEKARDFYKQHKKSKKVVHTKKRNLRKRSKIPSKTIIWKRMIGCLITTQQKSGPGSLVSLFWRQKPFPLSLELCRKQKNLRAYSFKQYKMGKLRMTERLAEQTVRNFEALEGGLWKELNSRLRGLVGKKSKKRERETARWVAKQFKGLGPKQSRNLLQGLGLSRYEIPLDSRLTKWMNEFGFPMHISAGALSNLAYYEFVLDMFQELCKKARITPCLMDAAVFTSFD